MTPLIELYANILKSVGCTVKDDFVYFKDKHVMVTSKGVEKKLVLPTDKVLRDPNWKETIAFHPACESIVAGQSEVLNVLIALGAAELHTQTMVTVAAIVDLASNKDIKNKLSLAQQGLFKLFEIDDGVIKLVQEIVKRNTGITGKYPLLSFKLDRNGVIDDTNYSRTCMLVTHVINREGEFCGYSQGSAASKQTVKQLFEYVFPVDRSFGSNSNSVPYLLSFLECYYNASNHLMEIRATLKSIIKLPVIDLKWHDDINKIVSLSKQHLPQALSGNQGVSLKHTIEPTNAPQPTTQGGIMETVSASAINNLPTTKPIGIVQPTVTKPVITAPSSYNQPQVQPYNGNTQRQPTIEEQLNGLYNTRLAPAPGNSNSPFQQYNRPLGIGQPQVQPYNQNVPPVRPVTGPSPHLIQASPYGQAYR